MSLGRGSTTLVPDDLQHLSAWVEDPYLERMVGSEFLHAYTGRGPTVDESAMVKALQEGWIAGAGLDVLEDEPPAPTDPLLRMDNVILTVSGRPD